MRRVVGLLKMPQTRSWFVVCVTYVNGGWHCWVLSAVVLYTSNMEADVLVQTGWRAWRSQRSEPGDATVVMSLL